MVLLTIGSEENKNFPYRARYRDVVG